MRKPIALLLLSALAVAGCVGPPAKHELQMDVTVPDVWAGDDAADDTPLDEDWWVAFEDPALTQVIELALERNYDLLVAAARVERAAAEARIAGAELKPSVGLGVNGGRQKQNFVGFPIPGGGDEPVTSTFSRYGLSVDTAWEVDLWGRLRASARAAVADFQATRADYRAAQQSLAAQTAKVWFAILEAREQLQLARNTAASRHSSAQKVRARYEIGVRPALDLRLALSNLASAEALVARNMERLDRTVRQLEVLLGLYPERTLLDRHEARNLPTHLPEVPVGLPANLIARRPDLIAAERRLAAADQRYKSARRSLYPRLALTGSGGTISDSFSDLLDGDFGVWSLVANLTAPLYQGGRLRAGVEAADAGAEATVAAYASAALTAYAEVESALAAEDFLSDQERYLEDSVRQLEAALRLAEDRYRQGVETYLTVLDSQTRSLVAESELISVRRQRLTNRVDLHLALGGGFEIPDDPDDPDEHEGSEDRS